MLLSLSRGCHCLNFLLFIGLSLISLWFSGPTGRAGGGSFGKREGGGGGQTGSSTGEEREGDSEKSHQEREAETQDNVQGFFFLLFVYLFVFTQKKSSIFFIFSLVFRCILSSGVTNLD